MFTLSLPYDPQALVPVVSEEGFAYHHGKHHAAYVKNLNTLLAGTPAADASLERLIVASHAENCAPIFNNAAQHWSHSFYWHCLSPHGGGAPRGAIGELIARHFGDFATFKTTFSDAAMKLFGSGWAWLVLDRSGALQITPLKDAHTPLTAGHAPPLTLDVWEHAYYIDHRNAWPKFVEGFWDIVNWDFANANLAAATTRAATPAP